MNQSYIEPRLLKGFRDFLPEMEIARRDLSEKIENSFRSFGFVPIDTPVLEYADILLGKGGGETEKQIYRFKDNGGRDVAMRFDLTVPFARFMAEHREELPLPFKRYHIAKAWRGENTQRGRYREFVQCDFDIVGSESASSDFEILFTAYKALVSLGAGRILIHVNHRGLFNKFLSSLDLTDNSSAILRVIDKLSKAGEDETKKNLIGIAGEEKALKVFEFIKMRGNFDETLDSIVNVLGECRETERLFLIRRFMKEIGIADSFVLDPSVTRGLDYYTGIVFESFLAEIPDIGSVCSGGRYDNLVSLYTKPNTQGTLSGVGAAIGLDRLISALEITGKLKLCSGYAKVALAFTGEDQSGKNQKIAEILRKENIPCEVFHDDVKLNRQYILAEKKGIKWFITAASDPENFVVRNIETRENIEINYDELVSFVKVKL